MFSKLSAGRTYGRLRKCLVALAMVGAVLAATATAAQASYTHNNRYSYSELRNGPSGGNLVIANLYNNTTVSMRCWADTSWWYGNYSSPRWFYVTVGWSGGWVHSSFVLGQISVPHC
jgi:hypothetical protein